MPFKPTTAFCSLVSQKTGIGAMPTFGLALRQCLAIQIGVCPFKSIGS